MQERPLPPPKKTSQIFYSKLLKNKSKNIHTFALKYNLSYVFPNFRKNLHNFVVPALADR